MEEKRQTGEFRGAAPLIFRRARRKRNGIVFYGGVYLGKNTLREESVRVKRVRERSGFSSRFESPQGT